MSADRINQLLEMAGVCEKQGRGEEALAAYQAVLDIDGKNVQALSGCAWLCQNMKMYDAAEKFYELLMTLKPTDEVKISYVTFLTELGKNDEAGALFRKMEAKYKKNLAFLVSYGNFLLNTRNLDKCIRAFKRALKIGGPRRIVLEGIGQALGFQNKHAESIPYFKKAMELEPGQYSAHFNLSMAYFQLGDLEKAWPLYESRLRPEFPSAPRWKHAIPVWDGEDLSDKTILLGIEQGIGDQILFAACVPEFQKMAGQVILEVHPKIVDIMAAAFPEVIVCPGQILETYDTGESKVTIDYDWLEERGLKPDYFISLVSGFGKLRPDLRHFPVSTPYLKADPALYAQYAKEIKTVKIPDSPLVGLSWRSGLQSGRRNATYETAEGYADLIKAVATPTTFVNLQYSVQQSELDILERAADGAGHKFLHFPHIDLFDDMVANLALINCMDYILIPMSNAQRVIAGGLGIPGFTGVHLGFLTFGYRAFNAIQQTMMHIDNDIPGHVNQVLSGEISFVDLAIQRFEESGDLPNLMAAYDCETLDDWRRLYAGIWEPDLASRGTIERRTAI